MSWFRQRRPQPPPQPAPEITRVAETLAGPTTQQQAQEMLGDLTAIVRRVNRAGAWMPMGAVPAIHEIEDRLRPLLEYLCRHPVTEAEMIPVRALVRDYLPTTVDQFIALPTEFVITHRGRHGLTPAQDLLTQLDAQELANQGRFLHTKFTRSDLDLG
ncbi:MAG: hypothetical protein CSB46_07035 [Micrococcales bacterium]|nr:MAG: hypothetical protein CSB46_07035 [Micrococcales bacterium]